MIKIVNTSRQVRFGLKVVAATLLVAILAVAAVSLVSSQSPVRSQAPTATELADDAPLGAAFRDAFVGQTGVYDPAVGLVQPDETHFNIQVQASHNGRDIFFRYQVPTPLASYYHDAVVYQDGKWVRVGKSAIGNEPHGLYEDRISMLVDDGSVKGFANQGGWLTCHEDLREPFMYASASNEDVLAHPVLGEMQGQEDVRKYIPQGRDAGPEWWQVDGWDDLSVANVEQYQERLDNGVFLDLWQWRAHRGNPIDYSDNQYVFDSRVDSPGKGAFSTNWDDDTGQPKFMFDSAKTGFYALKWDTIQAQGYGTDDTYFLAEGVNTVPFDPNRQWQDGDFIPRRFLRTPTESRGMIQADGILVRDGDEGWLWDVTLWRPMDTGYDQADKAFMPGRTYNAAMGIHRLSTGSRWHFVSLPFTIGVDIPGKVTANRFTGDQPDWSTIPATTLTLIYPGQTNWEWLTSDEHPGAKEVRADTMSVLGCHDEIGLAEANKAIESRIAGLGSELNGLEEPRSSRLDPSNVVFLYLLIAVGIIVGSFGLGRFHTNHRQEKE